MELTTLIHLREVEAMKLAKASGRPYPSFTDRKVADVIVKAGMYLESGHVDPDTGAWLSHEEVSNGTR